jgi:hypothetical protein
VWRNVVPELLRMVQEPVYLRRVNLLFEPDWFEPE